MAEKTGTHQAVEVRERLLKEKEKKKEPVTEKHQGTLEQNGYPLLVALGSTNSTQ